MKTNTLILFLAIVFFISAYSQERQKVSAEEYGKWSVLSSELLSPNGKWVAYKTAYECGLDTLYLQNVKKGNRRGFAKGMFLSFSPNNKWIAVHRGDRSLEISDIEGKQKSVVADVAMFDFTGDGQHLVVQNTENGKNVLRIFSGINYVESTLEDVTSYTINPSGKIAVGLYGGVGYYDLSKGFKFVDLIANARQHFSQITWNDEGTKLAYYQENKASDGNIPEYSLSVADLLNGSIFELNPALLPKDYSISAGSAIVFSPDDSQLIFAIISKQLFPDPLGFVEVWDSSTIYDYPKQQEHDSKIYMEYITLWDMRVNKVKRLEDDEFSKAFVLPGMRNILKYSTTHYEPQFEESPPADFYIEDIASGKRDLVIAKHPTEPYSIQVSPSGQFLSYFSNCDWYVYDSYNRTSINITAKLQQEFRNLTMQYPGHDYAFESPGFTDDSNFLIVHDSLDVWLFASDGSSAERITDGLERKIKFEVEKSLYLKNAQTGSQLISYNFNLGTGIVLKGTDAEKSTGYFEWSRLRGLRPLVWSKSLVSGIQKSSSSDFYLYTDETASRPPALTLLNIKKADVQTLFQSNAHYKFYQINKSKLLTYSKKNGEKLQGILQYPSNYVAGKKYPMIVYIYERLSQSLHQYINPSLQNPTGFNPANYTFDGYFVLMPDITYTIGQTGESALSCVVAAVEHVVEGGLVMPDNIGLIGHSFGGYEVGYIMTRTNLFARGVIGSGLSDLVKAYLSMNFADGRANTWRIEMQQYRMGVSLFDDYDRYVANSPISKAGFISTPILNWAGKHDKSVSWEQGLELHLALRRLGKENIFLLYPDDGHILHNRDSQLDLTHRIREWFRVLDDNQVVKSRDSNTTALCRERQ